ncbi:MAG: glutathione S-transferase [Gammaproteobacteria bacterium]|nr:glutathione S-transferase [Gammaproteobacteria bacterium]NNF66475.1 glutathione S-transferase [Gammaproteobacteria bacterium]
MKTKVVDSLPILYSFRRCPYAMRARLSLYTAGIAVELREILLKDKPPEMLAISSKGTVPVLQLADGGVIDESIAVMEWALAQHDPASWCAADPVLTRTLIDENDNSFKAALDRYKYFIRYPEQTQAEYRAQGEVFLQRLESQLAAHDGRGLVRNSVSFADTAIFPFIRQFAGVEPDWFAICEYPLLRQWLNEQTTAPAFSYIMRKYPLWLETRKSIIEQWKKTA